MAEMFKPPTLDLTTWKQFEKQPMEDISHKTFGAGVRRVMRNTVGVEVFAEPPSPFSTIVRVRTPNKTITLANGIAYSTLKGDVHIKQAETEETIVRTSGVIHFSQSRLGNRQSRRNKSR